MELERNTQYRLTSDILCVGEGCSGGLYYLRADTEVQVIDAESRPFIQVRHPNGRARLFPEDLIARAELIKEPIVRSAAA
jgi:hypothetical protein